MLLLFYNRIGDVMFLSSENISFEILSVLELNWQSRNDTPQIRPYPIISFRKIGSAKILYENKIFCVNTGDMMFVPAYCEYRIESNLESVIVVHFKSNDKLPDEIKIFKSESPSYIEQKFDNLHENWSRKQPGYIYECKSVLYKILAATARELSEIRISGKNDKIIKAVEHIHENFLNSDLSIYSLAQMCSMSDTYFRKIFYQNFSVTPLKYINSLKLNYALELLRSKYYTVQEIADKCGFDNVYYFSNFIKKETGMSPLNHINKSV